MFEALRIAAFALAVLSPAAPCLAADAASVPEAKPGRGAPCRPH